MKPSKPLQFAVLVDSNLLKRWQVETIQRLVAKNCGTLKCFIKNSETSVYQKSELSLGFRYLERKIRNRGPLEVMNIQEEFKEVESILIKPEMKGKSAQFSNQDLKQIESLKLDFILRFGFGILRGKILEVPKFGIWSFHHGDPKKYRGGPPGFWEILKKDPINGVILQQLTEKLDGGIILKEGFFKTIQHSYADNLYKILNNGIDWPYQVAQSIILNAKETIVSKAIETKAPIYKAPSTPRVFQFLLIQFWNKVKFHFYDIFRAEKWNVGIIDSSLESILDNEPQEVRWLTEAKGNSYYADPFGSANSDEHLLVEEYNYKSGIGKISALSVVDGLTQNVLQLETHLSYPFVFRKENIDFLAAENYESNQLNLYQLKNGKAINPKCILKGKWIDPTIIFYENTYWLFCTEKRNANEDLYLFYSNNLDEEFIPHPLNPVVSDICSARPAGQPFFRDNHWYRPGQNCSTTYGGSIQLKKIETLSKTAYSECFAKEVRPLPKSTYNKGLHTLSNFGNKSLIDGKRYYFNFHHTKNQIKIKSKRLFNN